MKRTIIFVSCLLMAQLCLSQTKNQSTDCNREIKRSKGKWNSPIKRYSAIMKNYFRDHHFGFLVQDSSIIFISDSAYEVASPISGSMIKLTDEDNFVTIMCGDYSLRFTGLTTPNFKTGEKIKKGQIMGILKTGEKGYQLEVSFSHKTGWLDVRKWFAIKFFN